MMRNRATPASRRPSMMCWRIGLRRTSIIGLGNSLVRSRIRVPRPAARRTALVITSLMAGVGLVFGRAIRSVAALELNGGVLDSETVVQFVRDLFEQLIVELWLALHHVGGAGGLGRTQSPDVEVMDFGDAGKLLEENLHRAGIDPARHGIEHQIDRIAQQAPSADENDYDDDEAADRIEQ